MFSVVKTGFSIVKLMLTLISLLFHLIYSFLHELTWNKIGNNGKGGFTDVTADTGSTASAKEVTFKNVEKKKKEEEKRTSKMGDCQIRVRSIVMQLESEQTISITVVGASGDLAKKKIFPAFLLLLMKIAYQRFDVHSQHHTYSSFEVGNDLSAALYYISYLVMLEVKWRMLN